MYPVIKQKFPAVSVACVADVRVKRGGKGEEKRGLGGGGGLRRLSCRGPCKPSSEKFPDFIRKSVFTVAVPRAIMILTDLNCYFIFIFYYFFNFNY